MRGAGPDVVVHNSALRQQQHETRSDPKWGERPVLVVEVRDACTVSDEEIVAPLRGRVPPWRMPYAVIRLASMPIAATGKIDKQKLRAEFG